MWVWVVVYEPYFLISRASSSSKLWISFCWSQIFNPKFVYRFSVLSPKLLAFLVHHAKYNEHFEKQRCFCDASEQIFDFFVHSRVIQFLVVQTCCISSLLEFYAFNLLNKSLLARFLPFSAPKVARRAPKVKVAVTLSKEIENHSCMIVIALGSPNSFFLTLRHLILGWRIDYFGSPWMIEKDGVIHTQMTCPFEAEERNSIKFFLGPHYVQKNRAI